MYRRRSRAARGRHDALRRLLSLVPRRHRTRPTTGRPTKAEAVKWTRTIVEPTATGAAAPRRTASRFGEALRVWLRVAALSFGGPAGQIAVMHRILVEEKRWIGESAVPARAQLLHAAAGPRGAAARRPISAGCCTGPRRPRRRHAVRPARLHRHHGAELHLRGLSAMSASSQALFFGLKAAVLAIVLEAVRARSASARSRTTS